MSKLRLSTEQIMKMGMFEKISNVQPIDCIISEDRIAFIIKEGEIGAAIGKGGEHVKEAEEKFGKKIDIIEYSNDWRKFVRNVFAPIKLEDVWIKRMGKDVIAFVKVNPKIKRIVLKNVNRALEILKRHTKITKIQVVTQQQRKPRRPIQKNENNKNNKENLSSNSSNENSNEQKESE